MKLGFDDCGITSPGYVYTFHTFIMSRARIFMLNHLLDTVPNTRHSVCGEGWVLMRTFELIFQDVSEDETRFK